MGVGRYLVMFSALAATMVWALTPLLAQAAGADTAPGTVLEGKDVIRYDATKAPVNATRFIRLGNRLPGGGCNFNGTITRQRAAAGFYEAELAYDPSTCRLLVADGTTPPSMAPATTTPVGYKTQVKFGSNSAPSPTSGSVAPAAIAEYVNWVHTWYSDPLGLHVNDVTNSIDYRSDRACAYASGQVASEYYYHEWLTSTGWTDQSDNWNFTQACTGISSSSYVN